MNDELGESLSSLMDGEASDADIERVLGNLEDEALRRRWSRFHNASQSLSAGAAGNVTGVDLSRRIMAAVAAEPALKRTEDSAVAEAPPAIRPVGRWRRFSRPLASFAVAASVCAAVLLSVQVVDGPGGGAGGVPAVVSTDRAGSGVVNPLEGAAVRADFSASGVTPSRPAADYDAIARDRLRRYLLPHTEEAALNAPQGMMPFARVASFETED
jgi:sigma-E factor negative regulatory protein RseA